jgi:uncharacterized protein YndB with AHSA1/START domain
MSESNEDGVISNDRKIAATPREIYSAFEQPEKLARWWGPAGFTNTFKQFEFEPGGRWVYVMHGPDGREYPNESVFRVIESDAKIVIEHVVLPHYSLTVTLTASGDQTNLAWRQEFENTAFVASMRSFLENANEENLDKLAALLAELNS